MEKAFHTLVSRIFSTGERAALRRLVTEFKISHLHRQGLRRLQRQGWTRPHKLNLGSGRYRKEGFLNVDVFPGGDLTLDLRRGLPFESNCCALIFSEHCLEHIDYPEPVSQLLRECLRVLQPGGELRFSIPDTEWPLKDYAEGPDASYFAACKSQDWDYPDYCSTRLECINFHFRQNEEHRFAYDEETVRKLLAGTGFLHVRKVGFDPDLDARHREVGSLFFTARKPD